MEIEAFEMYTFMDDAPRRVRYRAFTPDGGLWCESSDVRDFQPVELYEGMDSRERWHFEQRNATLATCRFERVSIYETSKVEEWKPW